MPALPAQTPQTIGIESPVLAMRRFPLRARTPDDEPYSDPPTLDELRDVCRGLLNALDDERRAAGATGVRLGPGSRLEVVGTGSRYRITISGPIDASTGDPVLLQLGHREVEGVIAATGERDIEVTLSEDMGQSLPAGGELLLEAPWMVARLRQRVREAFEVGHATPRLFNLTNALRTLGIGEIPVAATAWVPEYDDEQRPLNEGQARAVSTAFRSPLSIVAAPGGTGKTHMLAALVQAAARGAGLRVLVTAPSNVAVDLQMMQVCRRLVGQADYRSGDVMRVGTDAGAELRDSYGDEVVLDRVVARLRPKLQQRIERLQRAVDEIAARMGAAQRAGSGDATSAVQALRRQLATARGDLRQAQQEARDYGRLLVSEARVVGATLARVFLDPTLRGFDMVVIDEASMAQCPAVFLAAGLARKHVVIAGDPYQLAAPVHSAGAHREWLTTDVFHRLEVVSAIRHEEDVPYITQLTEQRRSAEGICALQRAVWYGPRLRTAREVLERERARPNLLFGGSSLCYVDTSALGAEAYRPWGRTYANEEHADTIADLIAYLGACGELPEQSTAGGEVLVLSHYRGQVWNLRKRLAPYRSRGVSVRTVHRAQGSEARTAIFDLTLTAEQPTRISSVLTATRPEQEGSRLLAVAVSRARSRFVFVGSLRWIEESVSPESVLGRVYGHLREHGREIALDEFRQGAPPRRLRMVR